MCGCFDGGVCEDVCGGYCVSVFDVGGVVCGFGGRAVVDGAGGRTRTRARFCWVFCCCVRCGC